MAPAHLDPPSACPEEPAAAADPVAVGPRRVAFRNGLERVGQRRLREDEVSALARRVGARDRRFVVRRWALRLAFGAGPIGAVAFIVANPQPDGEIHVGYLTVASVGLILGIYSVAAAAVIALFGETPFGRWFWRLVLAAIAFALANPADVLTRSAVEGVLVLGGITVALGGAIAGATAFFTDRAYAVVREPLQRDLERGEVWCFAMPHMHLREDDPPEWRQAAAAAAADRAEVLPESGLALDATTDVALRNPVGHAITYAQRPEHHVAAKRPHEREVARDTDRGLAEVERALSADEADEVRRYRSGLILRATLRGLGRGAIGALIVRQPLMWLLRRDIHEGWLEVGGLGLVYATYVVGRAILAHRRIGRDLEDARVHYVRDEADGAVLAEFLPCSGLILANRGVPSSFRTRA